MERSLYPTSLLYHGFGLRGYLGLSQFHQAPVAQPKTQGHVHGWAAGYGHER